jgi:molybdenum cofactor biosynthesis protein B
MGEQQPHQEPGSHTDHAHPSHLTHKTKGMTSLVCMVVTCSDSRTPDSDTSGKLICHLLKEQGHTIAEYRVIKDEPTDIRNLLLQARGREAIQVVIINGGTGISRRDSTFEAVDGFLEKRLDGFGELFRYLSYKDIGSSAMLSRATAGIHGRMVIFSIPGSQGAVRLAMEQLILPEMGHIAEELTK